MHCPVDVAFVIFIFAAAINDKKRRMEALHPCMKAFPRIIGVDLHVVVSSSRKYRSSSRRCKTGIIIPKMKRDVIGSGERISKRFSFEGSNSVRNS